SMETIMFKDAFGNLDQVQFDCPEDYFEFLGFLSRNDGTTRIVWEENDRQGAWGPEGRIHFYVEHPEDLKAVLGHTAGRGNVVTRVNCNEFVEHIIEHHDFVHGDQQDVRAIRTTIPSDHLADFERGRTMATS